MNKDQLIIIEAVEKEREYIKSKVRDGAISKALHMSLNGFIISFCGLRQDENFIIESSNEFWTWAKTQLETYR